MKLLQVFAQFASLLEAPRPTGLARSSGRFSGGFTYFRSMKSLLGEDCQREWLEFIEFHQKVSHVEAGSVILRQGDPVLGMYAIVKGKVKIIINDHGEERLVRLAANGDIIGHRGMGGDWHYPISAIALDFTTVSFLPLKVFDILAKSNAQFVYRLMMFFAEELRTAEQLQLQMPVLNRVARSLCMNYKAFGFEENSDRLTFTISRRDIASHAATTYESVIRTLADLAKRKVIRLEGKAIALQDLPRLQALATNPQEV
jgi:CRP-like cAMP-binding protein